MCDAILFKKHSDYSFYRSGRFCVVKVRFFTKWKTVVLRSAWCVRYNRAIVLLRRFWYRKRKQ